MPICPQRCGLYPNDWARMSDMVRLERAKVNYRRSQIALWFTRFDSASAVSLRSL